LLRERTRRSRHRPLLNAADPIARLNELYAARDALYREVASLVVESSRDEIGSFSRQLEAALQDSRGT
jgi:shikimate kinase